MAHEVFISYRHEDEEWASRICRSLEERNIPCWFARRDIAEGSDWPTEIINALKQSRAFVIVLSSHSVNEEQISREVRIAADELKLPIFPVRIEDVPTTGKLSYFLGDIQWLDAFGGKFDDAVARLANRIRGVETAPVRSDSPIGRRSTTAKQKPLLWIGIAAVAVFAIALIAFFATRKPGPQPISEPAKDAVLRFLNDLNGSNFSGAWNQLTQERKEHLKREQWIKEHEDERKANGPFTYTLNSCPAQAKNQGYACDMTLAYSGGKTGSANVSVMQEQSGAWAVSRATIGKPQ